MSEPVLLAKSLKDRASGPRFGEMLWGHTSIAMQCFESIFGTMKVGPTVFAERWLAFHCIPESFMPSFLVNGEVSCGLHDPGKATVDMQNLFHGKTSKQVIYHEHLSGLFLWLPQIAEWLDSIPHIDRRIVFSAVAGHHLRCKEGEFAECRNPIIGKEPFCVLPEGIVDVFRQVSQALDIPCHPEISSAIESKWSFNGQGGFDLSDLKARIAREIKKFQRKVLRNDPITSRLLAAVRAALILSDSAGSGIAREEKDLRSWLDAAFSEKLTGNYIADHIINPRILEISKSGRSFKWLDFQLAMDALGDRILLLAPCGRGKTLAAWRWIRQRLEDRPTARVIFLYPTRGTATEGFRDYVSWAPEADASLVSGTAEYDLEGMFEGPDDERAGKDFTTEDRLYALGFWHRRVFSATVDQFLGFLQHVYRSVCLMPLLADSVVVIDEVHSFDKGLFSALKMFLKNFNVPVLCMTASLPSKRRDELVRECGLEVFPQAPEAFEDLCVMAEMPRYRVDLLDGEEDAERIAQKALDEGKRVLWVVNTVGRCQRLAKKLNALCYHSRFKLEDRKGRHKAVIGAFQNDHGGILAITTQVCEMSLDLDADVLISEIGPITAMIQRMGRCNRHAGPGDAKLGEIYFYKPEDEKPYSKDDLTGSDVFINAVTGQIVGQSMLEGLLEELGPTVFEPERFTAYLENGPWAASREVGLRDDNEFSVTAILRNDLPRYFDMKKEGRATDGLYVPVPRRFAQIHPRLGPFPMVAEPSHYDPLLGFFDHPLEVII